MNRTTTMCWKVLTICRRMQKVLCSVSASPFLSPTEDSILAHGRAYTSVSSAIMVGHEVLLPQSMSRKVLVMLRFTRPSYKVDMDGALKRVPKDYPADVPCADFMRLKSFPLVTYLDNDSILKPSLVQRVAELLTDVGFQFTEQPPNKIS